MDDEIEAIIRIDFPAYLLRDGFELDRAESTAHSFKLRNGAEILILRRKPDGVWQYFSATDDHDNGTIIQYIQRRASLNLGQVRKQLRPWLAGSVGAVPRARPAEPELPLLDLADVRRRWASAAPVVGAVPYLTTRGLTAATVERFRATIRVDQSGNTLFAHTDDAGDVTGFEIKGPAFAGFAKGGRRALARFGPNSDHGDDVRQVAVTESGLDALSLAQLVGERAGLLVVSTSGAVSPVTLDLVAALASRYPAAEILLGFDADAPGARMTDKLLAHLAGHDQVRVIVPKLGHQGGKDWNDALKQRQKPAEPSRQGLRLGG